MLPESNRGMQHQSIEPWRETSAEEWQSERNAYSERRGYLVWRLMPLWGPDCYRRRACV